MSTQVCQEHGETVVVYQANMPRIQGCPFCAVESERDDFEAKAEDLALEVSGLEITVSTLEADTDNLQSEIDSLNRQIGSLEMGDDE